MKKLYMRTRTVSGSMIGIDKLTFELKDNDLIITQKDINRFKSYEPESIYIYKEHIKEFFEIIKELSNDCP